MYLKKYLLQAKIKTVCVGNPGMSNVDLNMNINEILPK